MARIMSTRITSHMDITMSEMAKWAAKLAYWFSPSFPVGAFAYSHGLEQAIADGAVRDRESVLAWIDYVVTHGSGWSDAVLFFAAFSAKDGDELHQINELALALCASKERYVETSELGFAFAKALAHSDVSVEGLPVGGAAEEAAIAYPVIAGAAAGLVGAEREAAIHLFMQGFTSNLVAVAQRLVPLGQADAVRVMDALSERLHQIAGRVAAATLDDLGAAGFGADLAAMKHEQLQPRIFRT